MNKNKTQPPRSDKTRLCWETRHQGRHWNSKRENNNNNKKKKGEGILPVVECTGCRIQTEGNKNYNRMSQSAGRKHSRGIPAERANKNPTQWRASDPFSLKISGKKIPPLLSFIRLAAAAHWSPHAGMSHSLASPSDD